KILYPEQFPEDLTALTRDFYTRFYHVTPTDAQIAHVLAGRELCFGSMPRSAAPGLLIAFAVLLVGLLLAFTVGRYPVSLAELLQVFASKLTGRGAEVPAAVENVIWQVRGPRVLAAALIGAALAVAGT